MQAIRSTNAVASKIFEPVMVRIEDISSTSTWDSVNAQMVSEGPMVFTRIHGSLVWEFGKQSCRSQRSCRKEQLVIRAPSGSCMHSDCYFTIVRAARRSALSAAA
jgi:hypothetical protein